MRKKVLGLACAMMMTVFLTACGIVILRVSQVHLVI